MDDIQLDFVLVRGPENVCRRLHVAVPADGTPVTIGRALHCGAVLDPWLVFASQVQCSVFSLVTGGGSGTSSAVASPAKDEDGGGEKRNIDTDSALVGSAQEATPTPTRRPLPEATSGGSSSTASAATATPHPLPRPRLFLTDMCSSNGTFVNGVRVSSADAVELKDGDACIFGGMRDVEVGAALPEDAFAGPELVVWRVDIVGCKGGQPTQYPYEATPAVLPSPEALTREGQEVLSTALRSLRRASGQLLQTPGGPDGPAPASHGDGDGATPASPASPAVPVQLFAAAQTPATEVRRPPREGDEAHEQHEGANGIDDDEEQRRSATVAARVSAPAAATAIPARPPSLAPTEGASSDHHNNDEEEPQPQPQRHGDTDFFLLLHTLETPSNAAAGVTEPPPLVYFHAVRVGRHTFHVPVPALLGAYVAEAAAAREELELGAEEPEETEGAEGAKRARSATAAAKKKAAAARKASARTPQPTAQERLAKLPTPQHAIHFTASHWKWVMDNPSGGGRSGGSLPTGLSSSSTFHAMLPVTSIQSILVCKERLGVSVELKDGCNVPLVRPDVLDGAPENRWLVWMLEDCQVVVPATEEASAKEGRVGAAKQKADGRRRRVEPGVSAEPIDLARAATSSLHERFDEWVAHMAAFYSAYQVPAPLAIDPDTFDKLFAPERIVE